MTLALTTPSHGSHPSAVDSYCRLAFNMPPKKKVPAVSDVSRKPATENDLRFFESYLRNMKTQPDVAWDDVAADMGLAHGGSARERFRQIKQKLGWGVGPATPKRKKKATAVIEADDSDDVQIAEPTPKKQKSTKTTAAGSKKDNVKTEETEGAVDQDWGGLA